MTPLSVLLAIVFPPAENPPPTIHVPPAKNEQNAYTPKNAVLVRPVHVIPSGLVAIVNVPSPVASQMLFAYLTE